MTNKPRHRFLAAVERVLRDLALRLEEAQSDKQDLLVAAKIITGHEEQIAAGLKGQVSKIENPLRGFMDLATVWVGDAENLQTKSKDATDPIIKAELECQINVRLRCSEQLLDQVEVAQAQFDTLLDWLELGTGPSSSGSDDQEDPGQSEDPGQREAG